ncbi:hypothetical protein LZ30DRAFT_743804 [Colletotrichum cereale]|nr:hypothetical protein LZ30DRAFT_743804 [Colletotrichum cereale]
MKSPPHQDVELLIRTPPQRSNGSKRRARRMEAQQHSDYPQFGLVGRRTGVQLPFTSELDKDGMPPFDKLFSSPERNGNVSDDETCGTGPKPIRRERDANDIPNSDTSDLDGIGRPHNQSCSNTETITTEGEKKG